MPRERGKVPKYFSLKKAREIQRYLSSKIIKEDQLPSVIRHVAGVDVAYVGDVAVAAVAVLSFDDLKVLEKKVIVDQVFFPYIPTLLSFRELKPALKALREVKLPIDVLMVDAHGYSHPYRLGFASHLGVVIKIPTIGVAKKLLCGRIGEWRGAWAPILDNDEVIGAAVKTKDNAKPVYVSIGNMISLETAISIVLKTVKSHRIPEPTRQAHLLCTKVARRIRKTGVFPSNLLDYL